LVLEVIPRISPDGLVVMSVFANKSELGSVADGLPVSIAPNGDAINAPRIATTQAETTISAVSGQTVVLSGLLTKRDQALHRRVPLLADIPLLGDLFRFDSTRTVRTELLIILTPHIVRNRYDAERIKQIESARMSWCLADVVNLHGPAGLKSNHDFMGEAEAESVYPDYVPKAEEIETPNRAGDIDQLQPIPQIYPESMRTNQPPTVDQTP
jgi:general secretion pathway protein D